MQGTLKCAHTLGILAALGFSCSSVTTVPPFIFAQAITKGSATGVTSTAAAPDQALEVLGLEYLRNKLKFSGVRSGKDLLILFRPRQHIRTYVLPPKFIPYFTG